MRASSTWFARKAAGRSGGQVLTCIPNSDKNQTLELRGVASRRASVNEVGGTNVMVPGFRYQYELDARRAGEALMPTARAIKRSAPVRQHSRQSATPCRAGQFDQRPAEPDHPAPRRQRQSGSGDRPLPGVVVTPQADLLPTDGRLRTRDSQRGRESRASTNSTVRPVGRSVSVNQNGVEVDVLQ